MTNTQVYKGTETYIADPDLIRSVNVAIALKKPLLLKGEPGTGKTMLAQSIAESLGLPMLTWNIKSTTKAQEGLYTYDTVQRLYDSQFHDRDVKDITNYIRLGKLGEAFTSEEQVVLLIDEIDKADLEFPNDLLWELDRMEFFIPETGQQIRCKVPPIVIITSNAEKELPDPFLRRCLFHFIEFPDAAQMTRIVKAHLPNLEENLLQKAMDRFYEIRKLDDIQKKCCTSELLDWLRILALENYTPEQLAEMIPSPGLLVKKTEDMDLLRRKGWIHA